jgi:glycosyltransferase involved in cell wall biosynthesis
MTSELFNIRDMEVLTETSTTANEPASGLRPAYSSPRFVADAVRAVRVLMFDLLPTVPYYTGHLCAALRNTDGLQVELASATYPHDRGFFDRMGLSRKQGLVDLAYRVRTPYARRVAKFSEYFLNLSLLSRKLMKNRPDIVHMQFVPLLEHGLSAELNFLRRLQALGVRLVYTVHNVAPHDQRFKNRSPWPELYQQPDALICHDLPTRQRLTTEFGIDVERVHVIPHGPLFAAENRMTADHARDLVGLPKGLPIVLFQGIIRPYKGVSLLLDAWKAATDRGLKAILAIVGTGDKASLRQIRTKIHSLGISTSVRLDFRFISVEELSAYYAAADVLALPYSAITGSGALMTAVSRKKAIVASDLPGFRNILAHGKDSLLVPYADVDAWARTMTSLATSESLRTRLAGELAAKQADATSWHDIACQTREVYRQALGRN